MENKCWKKGRYNSWSKKNGVEIESYGHKTTYPFIQIGKHYNSKTGKYNGFDVMRYGTHTSETLKKFKTKSQALKFANKYMKEHNKC